MIKSSWVTVEENSTSDLLNKEWSIDGLEFSKTEYLPCQEICPLDLPKQPIFTSPLGTISSEVLQTLQGHNQTKIPVREWYPPVPWKGLQKHGWAGLKILPIREGYHSELESARGKFFGFCNNHPLQVYWGNRIRLQRVKEFLLEGLQARTRRTNDWPDRQGCWFRPFLFFLFFSNP